MDALDRAIVNRLQEGFPVCDSPYLVVAREFGVSEGELLIRVARMLGTGVLTRFGPLYRADRMGGAFTLAAISVPQGDIERVAGIVNAMPEVGHNYLREHAFNMWFVLATEHADDMDEVIARIELRTGYAVLNLPKEREYFVGLRLAA